MPYLPICFPWDTQGVRVPAQHLGSINHRPLYQNQARLYDSLNFLPVPTKAPANDARAHENRAIEMHHTALLHATRSRRKILCVTLSEVPKEGPGAKERNGRQAAMPDDTETVPQLNRPSAV
jgi:hypothetical protein